jgi:hypothetical protein
MLLVICLKIEQIEALRLIRIDAQNNNWRITILSIHPLLKRLLFVALFACTAQTQVAQAALLSLQPDATIAANGESVSLELVVSGLGDTGADSLGAFDVSILYDAGVLSFASYTLNGLLGDLGLFEAIDISAGDSGGFLNIAEVSLLAAAGLDALQSSEFVLASLNFGVLDLASGATTQLSILRGARLTDANGNGLQVSDGRSAIVEGRATVPLPGTFLLLFTALFGWKLTCRSTTITL